MSAFRFNGKQRKVISELIKQARNWAHEHQCLVGVAEVALGIGLLQYGAQQGIIQFGTQVVGTAFDASAKVGLASGGVAGLGAYLLGNIGVAALGGAVGIPALFLSGGAALVFGLAGYGAASVISKFQSLSETGITAISVFKGSVFLRIAVALVLDGAIRIAGSGVFERIGRAVSSFVNGVLRLIKLACQVVVKKIQELNNLEERVEKHKSGADVNAFVSSMVILLGIMSVHHVNLLEWFVLLFASPVYISFLSYFFFSMRASEEEEIWNRYHTS